MNAVQIVTETFERTALPDPLRRAAIEFAVGRSVRNLSGAFDNASFAEQMAARAIAEHADRANAQHYELPAELFEAVLGPRLKYSCGYYATGQESLTEAEEAALAETCTHAGMADGQTIFELGCGWGSLSLWMAEHLPKARILSVSNSATQKRFIDARATRLGLGNLEVVTADMNDFDPGGRFDRIVSVEMFEHMTNWRALLARARTWLKDDGALFLHVFSHRSHCHRFDDEADWIGRHFFTGGLMPSHGLIREFGDLFAVEGEWRWGGYHYRRTAEAWLSNFDRRADVVSRVMRETYGGAATLWARRWRLFFLAVAGLFGHAGGLHWGVSHFRLRPV